MEPSEIDSAEAFRNAIVAAAAEAVIRRERKLVLADPDFDEWPLEHLDLIEALSAFVRLPGRQVLLLGRNFDGVVRRCARFVRWRQTWSHSIDARRPVDDEVTVPTLLLGGTSLAVEVFDKVHWRGKVRLDTPAVRLRAQEIDVFAQRTEPTFGASTLGL